MKTLIDSTEKSATYEFSYNGCVRTVVYDRDKMMNLDPDFAPDFEAMSDVDHDQWLEWIKAGETPVVVDPLAAAESYVARYYSTPRLLQMKVWWDTFPHDDVPKLAAVYEWTNAITIQAAQGQTTFTEPPHTFEELVAEAMEQLGL